MLCLDSRKRVRFTIAGVGALIDNRGTTKASRVVEPYNGRVETTLIRTDGESMVGVAVAGIKPAFYTVA